jgi:hypothetical protein
MLANESRGVIVHPNNPNPTDKLVSLITNTNAYDTMTTNAMNWSRMYTLEKFEREIQDLIR